MRAMRMTDFHPTPVGRELRLTFADGAGAYRPDLHYMRGPGPKWHAKYGIPYPNTPPADKPAAGALHTLAERRA